MRGRHCSGRSFLGSSRPTGGAHTPASSSEKSRPGPGFRRVTRAHCTHPPVETRHRAPSFIQGGRSWTSRGAAGILGLGHRAAYPHGVYHPRFRHHIEDSPDIFCRWNELWRDIRPLSSRFLPTTRGIFASPVSDVEAKSNSSATA